MRRSQVRRRGVVLALLVAAGLLAWLAVGLLDDPPPAIGSGPVPPAVAPLPRSRPLPAPAIPAGPGAPRLLPDPDPPLPTGEALADVATWSAVQEAVVADPRWKEHPPGVEGPVVVGAVVLEEDPDPECWVALEAVDDPERLDPSAVTTLTWGRFRLTGFEPGTYRVRARTDGGLAVYSEPFTVDADGVADAGLLRLRGPGRLQGLVRDATGAMVDAEVRLHGRDPATMEPVVHARTVARGSRGFELRPEEAGPFRLSVEGEAGRAEVEGVTDETGAGWIEVRLEPWAAFAIRIADAPPGDTTRVVLGAWELESLDGGDGRRLAARGVGPSRHERLPAGLYRLRATVRSALGSGDWLDRPWNLDVRLAPGAEQVITVPR